MLAFPVPTNSIKEYIGDWSFATKMPATAPLPCFDFLGLHNTSRIDAICVTSLKQRQAQSLSPSMSEIAIREQKNETEQYGMEW